MHKRKKEKPKEFNVLEKVQYFAKNIKKILEIWLVFLYNEKAVT